MRKKLNVFNTVLFTLIFCFMLGNCEDISFDKSLVKQIEDDTTFTIQFCGGPLSSPEWSNMVFLKYKIGSTITAADLPNTNTNSEMASWKPGYVIKSWKVQYNSVSSITLDSESVSSIVLNGNDVTLYPEWSTAKTLTLMDGCSGASAGKEFSGNYSGTIKFWTGENVKLPKTEAVFVSGQNEVEFDGWYKDANLSTSAGLTLDSEGNYFWQTDASTDNTTLYAKWKYKYVYFDPANKTGKAYDANTGIDRNHPVSTVAEAKKYMMSNDKAEAVKMMSGISSNFSDLSDLTTSTYNNAVYLRDSTFKGVIVLAQINSDIVEIENSTFDGGYDGSEASKAEASVMYRGQHKLTNVTIKNNYNKENSINSYSAVFGDNKGYSIKNCVFSNNYSSSGSVLGVKDAGTIENTQIYDNTGNGIRYACNNSFENKLTISGCIIENNVNGYNLYASGNQGSWTNSEKTTIDISDTTFNNAGVGSGNIFAEDHIKFQITSDVSFDTAPVRFDYVSADKSSYPAFVLSSAYPGPKVTGTTNNVVIYSEKYTANPIVLEDDSSGSLVAAKYTQFTCGHSSSGYVINNEGKIVPNGSISIGIDNPGTFTEIDPGNLVTDQVYLESSGETKIRFNLNSDVASKLVEWGLQVDSSVLKHPIQYVIDDVYGCVQVKRDSYGVDYAEIVLTDINGGSGVVPNDFGTPLGNSLSKGLHSLQIYSEAADTSTNVIIKKNYTIVVK